MINPKTKTEVRHSQTKAAWNVVGITPGLKYKIARCPYLVSECEKTTERERKEAFEHAEFISKCFNNMNKTE